MVDPVADAAKQWQSEGWVLVPDLVPASDIDAAAGELWGIFPRPEEFRDPDHPRRKAFLEGRIRNWGPVEGAIATTPLPRLEWKSAGGSWRVSSMGSRRVPGVRVPISMRSRVKGPRCRRM